MEMPEKIKENHEHKNGLMKKGSVKLSFVVKPLPKLIIKI
jgi:hypothetical protein